MDAKVQDAKGLLYNIEVQFLPDDSFVPRSTQNKEKITQTIGHVALLASWRTTEAKALLIKYRRLTSCFFFDCLLCA